MENAVYLHLKYLGYEINIGQLDAQKIDFIASKQGIKNYFQVCYLLNNQKTIEREFGNLIRIKDNYPKYVLSFDKFSEGNVKRIIQMNIIDFLTQENF